MGVGVDNLVAVSSPEEMATGDGEGERVTEEICGREGRDQNRKERLNE